MPAKVSVIVVVRGLDGTRREFSKMPHGPDFCYCKARPQGNTFRLVGRREIELAGNFLNLGYVCSRNVYRIITVQSLSELGQRLDALTSRGPGLLVSAVPT